MNYHIGEYEIKTTNRELIHKNRVQKVEPLILNLLIFMLKNPNRVLSRDELINSVWKSRVISDSALNATICTTRHAIGDTAKKQECIKTVSGSGYRFIANFTSSEDQRPKKKNNITLITPSLDEEQPKTLALPDKPSVAVMDFIDLNLSEGSSLLTYGLTAEINSALARLPHLFVIARPSASNISKLSLSSRQAGQRLGVRYLIYGNIHLFSKQLQITLSIVDANQDTEIWSEHFNRSLDDLFLLQEEITSLIVKVIGSVIEQAEIERAFIIPTEDMSAWENYHRGLWHIDRTTVKDIDAAQCFFKKALKQDTRFARAYTGLSYTHTSKCLLKHTLINKTDEDIKKSIYYANKSIDYSKHDSMGYMALARNTLYSDSASKAIPLFDQAIDRCQNSMHSHVLKAQGLSRLGNENKLAHQLLDTAERQNPHCRTAKFNVNIIRAMLFIYQKDYQKAVFHSTQAVRYNDVYYIINATAAASHQLAGDTEKAKQYANQALEVLPNCTIDSCQRVIPYATEPRDIYIKALLDAGIPKGNQT